MRRLGIGRVSFKVLEEILDFPKDHHIRDIDLDMRDRESGSFSILISGRTLRDVPLGERLPEISLEIDSLNKKCIFHEREKV